MVMAAGVAMYVAYLSNFDSLQRTLTAYYADQRFADVFVSLKRAPERLTTRIRAIEGVEIADTRVVVGVTLDVPGMEEPAAGLLVSVPADARPALNDVFLRSGRWPEAGRSEEVIASEAFCIEHGFEPGAEVAAIINGRRRQLRIVGIALSPEYIYSSPPGEMIPDDRRYGVFWMERGALAAAYDMVGGFNQLSLALTPGASEREVIDRVDQLLTPYGGLGAIPRAQQYSAWTIANELTQLQTFGFFVPALFLCVAAFILNIALARALALQRPQVAALKALGYANGQLTWHYLKWAMAIALVGGIVGVAGGAWLGSGMIGIYNQYFRFPALAYELSAPVIGGALLISLVAAVLGAGSAVARAVRIPPAEAMKPEAPVRYRRSVLERVGLHNHLRPTARMVLRTLERQPVRTAASILGIALAGGILFVGFVFIDAMTALMDTEFQQRMRQDVTVTFAEPRSAAALHDLEHLPGVMRVEPARIVPVRLRAGHRERTLAITGLPITTTLNRIIDQTGRAHPTPPEGLLVSSILAEVLGVTVGDAITVEVLEGARPVVVERVAALVEDNMGLQAYMDVDRLHRLMREGRTVSMAYLQVDQATLGDLHAQLKLVPAVAGVALTEAMRQSFREVMAENLNLQILINVVFAGIIACGVVYNAARISLSERSRELASLRVLGFTRREISGILLGELAAVTAVALPVGSLIGYGLSRLIVGSLTSEVFRIPLVVQPSTIAWGWIVIATAATLSGLVVRRRLDQLDLVAVLKTRE
jgi:putative ABC transport system permease protein